jgi:succinate dehydrogenase/fumarate reductase flavoprotein subunit
MGARDPHELMRCMEIHFIRDCAEMAARASLFRRESRWGLYHYRLDYPNRNDEEWLCNTIIEKSENSTMEVSKQPLQPYIIDVNLAEEKYDVAVVA